MKALRNQIEIEFLKSLSYEEINDIINEFKVKIEELEAQSNWVDVKTPPKHSDDVYIWIDLDQGWSIIGYYEDGSWYNDDGNKLTGTESHWQEITPPKE